MRFILSFIFLGFFNISSAQYAMNLGITKSPARSITQKVGYTEVSIKYGSPSVRGRKIWGDLEPFDEVWRAGANYASTIEFSESVRINQQNIPKGIYSFFVIPKKEKTWTLILNKTHKQWGAFKYNPAEDMIRIEVEPQDHQFKEQLNYDIMSYDAKGGAITLAWENILLAMPFTTNLKASLESQLNTNLETAKPNSAWINYLQAAEILLEEKEALPTALEWINKGEVASAEAMEWDERFYPKDYILGHLYWIKAKILAALDRKPEALVYFEKMKKMEGQKFYLKEQESEGMEGIVNAWKK